MSLHLEADERAMLEGEHGEALALAMRIVTGVAAATGAGRLLEVTAAHIDGCLYHGTAGLDFAERLAGLGARVRIPATLNVSSLDLLHPDLYRGDASTRAAARRLMDAYVAMGCRPTWTCAPYQLPKRPARGEHVAWAESNAIVFANSVLGARTDRYGDFIDICAALTGRVPLAGLHLDEGRRGEMVFEVSGVRAALLAADALYPVLGHLVGLDAGSRVPVLLGLPPETSEDRLKALGAAAASSGAVAMFHAVGVTPEAPTLEAALGGREPASTVVVNEERIRAARDDLGDAAEGSPIDAVSVGTPHLSTTELEMLVTLVERWPVRGGVPLYASTGRGVLEAAGARGWVKRLEDAGVTLVADTCTYVTPILDPSARTVMTSSGKWAYYAPGNLGVSAVFGSLEECVRSAARGAVVRDRELWGG